jgi:hypothetical protein
MGEGYTIRRQGTRLLQWNESSVSTPSIHIGAHTASYTWVPGVLSLGVKRPGREADHSHPSTAVVKNAWSYTSNPPPPGAQLKHGDKFAFIPQFR